MDILLIWLLDTINNQITSLQTASYDIDIATLLSTDRSGNPILQSTTRPLTYNFVQTGPTNFNFFLLLFQAMFKELLYLIMLVMVQIYIHKIPV